MSSPVRGFLTVATNYAIPDVPQGIRNAPMEALPESYAFETRM